MQFDAIWKLERRFWLEGVDMYKAHLHEDALMIFPGMGILDRAAVLDGLRAAPRWTAVEISDQRAATSGGIIVLAYAALARRADDRPYRAYCGSSYVRAGDSWSMIAHQQTPKV